ncbi:Membrane protein involved in the export of O-antigen and teichoic acid [Devosia lucknowensis]|uniref:Membrane protein involved in the export of O-antigen and teichoic acid n=1 Tax=Devosia lucknowensis TaxID=1096929 RepID=A0A1Y6FLY4_9HYPH|nr:lipopolysaccharide biosynthesis protein [Devosia lucknowensis]SMQ76004.1 Membrane protein involved in the export of O-antigen and teichoic acid [Devosia lucknowensis]
MSAVSDTGGGRLDHLRTGRASAAIRGTLWSLISSFAPAALGFLVFLATSRVLSPSEFGVVAFAASIATVGMAVAPAGFREALIQRSSIGPVHLDTVFWICMTAAFFIYAALCLASPFISGLSGEEPLRLLIPFIAARVIFDMAAAVPNALLVRTMNFKMLALRTTIASAVAAVVCLGLLWMGMGVWALAASQVAASVTTCAGAMIAARYRPGLSFSTRALGELKAFGLFSTGNHFITTINLDQLLVGALLGPAWLGIYGFARRIFQILTDLISGALNLVSYALLSSMQREPAKLREAYLLGTFASSMVAFPVFSGLALIAGDLIPLAFGEHWSPAVPVVQAFCVLGILTSVGILQSALIRSQGQADIWFYYVLGKQAVTVLYIFLFAGWGIVPLSVALVMLNCFVWLPTIHMVVRLLDISVLGYLRSFALPALATGLMWVVGWQVQQLLADAGPWVRLGATTSAAALSYGAVMLVLGWDRLEKLLSFVRRRGR